ncbi:DUF6232 family protein [Promicromonospora thailandica]|uniref:Uncharacterized protein n=1 Tax=Promicromonospora thailandica TaxID=765201 RepID=A0A9X2FZM1_9MICO|nr:DUF6232 family protein [Promicromonospora thailandica]MCP2264337.1 hypothetical protein [Promicromonospora thailandica]BFF20973.1 hypothetical protein GCM10025730_44940 [Promicromonospora thailandica]
MLGEPRYRYAVREVRVANGVLTIGLTSFALSNVMRLEVITVARPQPIGAWANQVAYPFAIVAVVVLLLRMAGADGIPWEAALAMGCAGLAWPAARLWQQTPFWKPVWRYPVYALQMVTASQHVHRICAHDDRHLAALAELVSAAMKDPSISYRGTVQLISNADQLHTLEAGKDSMVR